MWSVAVPAAWLVPFAGVVLGPLAIAAAVLVSAAAVTLATLATIAGAVAFLAGWVSAKFWGKGSDHDTSEDKWTRSAMDNFKADVETTIGVGMVAITIYATLRAYASGLLSGSLAKMMPETLRVIGANISGPAVVNTGGGQHYWVWLIPGSGS